MGVEGSRIALIALGETSLRRAGAAHAAKEVISLCLLFPRVPRKVGISFQLAPG